MGGKHCKLEVFFNRYHGKVSETISAQIFRLIENKPEVYMTSKNMLFEK